METQRLSNHLHCQHNKVLQLTVRGAIKSSSLSSHFEVVFVIVVSPLRSIIRRDKRIKNLTAGEPVNQRKLVPETGFTVLKKPEDRSVIPLASILSHKVMHPYSPYAVYSMTVPITIVVLTEIKGFTKFQSSPNWPYPSL